MRTRGGRPTRLPLNGGVTIVEVLLGMTVAVVALGAFLGTTISGGLLQSSIDERAVAVRSARATLEAIQNTEFAELFASYNANPEDDPDGAGTAPGQGFTVPGLDARADDLDGLTGRIEFPTEAGNLREDVVDPGLGMPRDLDGDGAIDGADHAADYRLLPVRVVVEWIGKSGRGSVELTTILCEM